MSSTLRRALSDALPKAMKERDRAAVSALRTALAAVANAEAVDPSGVGTFATEVDRRHLTEREITAIVRGIHDELRVASDEMLLLGQAVRAGELTEQAEALHGFLET